MAKGRRAKGRVAPLPPRLGDAVAANRAVLKVLDKHGITFCAGCYLTLFSSPEKAALYHAVPDAGAFLRDLRRALRRQA